MDGDFLIEEKMFGSLVSALFSATVSLDDITSIKRGNKVNLNHSFRDHLVLWAHSSFALTWKNKTANLFVKSANAERVFIDGSIEWLIPAKEFGHQSNNNAVSILTETLDQYRRGSQYNPLCVYRQFSATTSVELGFYSLVDIYEDTEANLMRAVLRPSSDPRQPCFETSSCASSKTMTYAEMDATLKKQSYKCIGCHNQDSLCIVKPDYSSQPQIACQDVHCSASAR